MENETNIERKNVKNITLRYSPGGSQFGYAFMNLPVMHKRLEDFLLEIGGDEAAEWSPLLTQKVSPYMREGPIKDKTTYNLLNVDEKKLEAYQKQCYK